MFDIDIFISYARIDDKPFAKGEEGWVATFHDALENRLSVHMGEQVKIWRDMEGLESGDLWEKKIYEKLEKAALVIAIISPRFVASQWCVREIEYFAEIANNNIGFKVDNKIRVVKVVKFPVDNEKHPEAIRESQNFDFYYSENQRPKEINIVTKRDLYENKLEELAWDIHLLLKRVRLKAEEFQIRNYELGIEQEKAEKEKADAQTRQRLQDLPTSEELKEGSFTDSRDGHIYKTIKIGNQTWMAENLAYKASDGCWTYDNNENNVAKYGYLYNWETAKKICPAGWHLPSDDEWNILINFLGGDDKAGGKLKSTNGWTSPNTRATNESGFTALPGGYRYPDGTFYYVGNYGSWWSSTAYDASYAWYRGLYYGNATVGRSIYGKADGFSVRCVRD